MLAANAGTSRRVAEQTALGRNHCFILRSPMEAVQCLQPFIRKRSHLKLSTIEKCSFLCLTDLKKLGLFLNTSVSTDCLFQAFRLNVVSSDRLALAETVHIN